MNINDVRLAMGIIGAILLVVGVIFQIALVCGFGIGVFIGLVTAIFIDKTEEKK